MAETRGTARVTIAPHAPTTISWRTSIAQAAVKFFSVNLHQQALGTIGKTEASDQIVPFAGSDFAKFLQQAGFGSVWPMAAHVQSVLDALVTAGLLIDQGVANASPVLNRAYWFQGGITRSQQRGDLWLAKALGPELVIPIIGASTIAITGIDTAGDARCASGIAVDDRHIVTCAHVVNDMVVDSALELPAIVPPVIYGIWPSHTRPVAGVFVDAESDVAVVEIEGGLMSPGGLAFRDPAWSDSVTLFGYPRVPQSMANHLVVQRGEVVNPDVRTFSSRPRFLYSAVARPGNSGGPVVASDGRIVGLVVGELAGQEASAAPFFAGIPTREIAAGLDAIGLRHIIEIEDWE